MLVALVKTADVLVENARPGVAKRLGMDYDTLSEVNPRLIYASISGFGQTGPWSQRPGFDLIAQSMSGVLSANGLPGGEPIKSGIPIADLGAGMFAAYAILSALYGRVQSGEGEYIDASLLEAATGLSVWETTELWGTGKSPQPLGSANRMSAPYQAVKASDGYFVIGAANDGLWRTFLQVIGRPELNDDPRFTRNRDRITPSRRADRGAGSHLPHAHGGGVDHSAARCGRAGRPPSVITSRRSRPIMRRSARW